MMKRLMACVLVTVLLLTAFAFAEGASMKVVNVKKSVNLRSKPSTDSKSLAMVPVGTVVTDCVKEGKWYSVNYNGTTGYIRGDKLELVEEAPAPAESKPEATVTEGEPLQPAEAPAENTPAVAEGTPLVAEGTPLQAPAEDDGRVEDAPVASINEASKYEDDFVILDTVIGNVRVIGRQIYQEDKEYLMAVGLDADGNELWLKDTATHNITELMQTDIFIGGTMDKPLVMMYNACTGGGLTAIDPATGDVVWELPRSTVNLGGSISYVVDGGTGIAYIGGYYGPDPVAVDANGNVLWQSDSGREGATWLYRVELEDDGIACAYGSMAGENTGTIVYDFNGNVLRVDYD